MNQIEYAKYGVFWIPPSNISEDINAWKQLIREVEPTATYLDHPVHSTLFLVRAETTLESAMTEALKDLAYYIKSVPVSLNNWLVFYNDAATGGHTLTREIGINQLFRQLQQAVAVKLQPFRYGEIPYAVNWKNEYLKSYLDYGFPFVGDHWKPHISIASVQDAGKIVIDQALNTNLDPLDSSVNYLSLYRIDNNTHTLIETIPLS